MTIAAGFQCVDGIVLCADSEITIGNSLKAERSKVLRFDSEDCKILFTGAGDSSFIEMTVQKIVDDLPEEKSIGSIRMSAEKSVLGVHQKQVRYYPHRDKPEIFLLMAIWIKKDGTDEVGFLKTAATAVTTAHWYECIGAGTDIGDYIASRFYSQLMTVKEAVALSIHLLRQVKDYALYCGKSSHIWVLARDGSYDLYSSTKVVRAEQYFDDFGHAEQDLIFSAYGSALNDEEFEERLQNFCLRIRDMRENQKIREKPDSMFGLPKVEGL